MRKIALLSTFLINGLCSFAQEIVKDINTTPKTGSVAVNKENRSLVNSDGVLYFEANDGRNTGLWRTNGTEAGTSFVCRTPILGHMVSIGCDIYFYAGLSQGTGIWKYSSKQNDSQNNNNHKGKLGEKLKETLLENIDHNISSNILGLTLIRESTNIFPESLRNFNGTLVFVESIPYTNGLCELWKSDGTIKGTVSSGIQKWEFGHLTVTPTFLYFSATDEIHGNELWKTNLSLEGTNLVKDINAVYLSTGDTKSSNPENHYHDFIAINDQIYFVADDGIHGKQLWTSNGTNSGTYQVRDLGEVNQFNSYELFGIGETLFFTFTFYRKNAKTNEYVNIGEELWKTDGTSQGTILVKDINPVFGSNPSNFANVNGLLYFSANDGIHGTELWQSNGTDIGTFMLKDINTILYDYGHNNSSNPHSFVNSNGIIYFVANDGIYGEELWKTDGTTEGTRIVSDIKPYSDFGSSPSNLILVNGVLYFFADDGPRGIELWKLKTIR